MLNGEVVPFFACHGKQFVTRLQLGYIGRGGKFVPWAGLLTAVAAVDNVAHGTLCFCADSASILYGLIRKAKFGIERLLFGGAVCAFFGERLGGTGIYAAATRTATTVNGLVVIKLKG